MYRYVKYLKEDGTYTDLERIHDMDFYDECEYCPECNSYSCFTWNCTTGEHSISCSCCGYNYSYVYDEEFIDDDLGHYSLIKGVNKKESSYKDKTFLFIAEISKSNCGFNYSLFDIKKEFIDTQINEILIEFNQINTTNEFSLLKSHPTAHKVEVIEGLYKGLVINMSSYNWTYENIPEGIYLKDSEPLNIKVELNNELKELNDKIVNSDSFSNTNIPF